MYKVCLRAVVVAVGGLAWVSQAHAGIIASWGFELNVPPTITSAAQGPLLPDIGTGQATGFHASAATHWTTLVGNGSAHAWASDTWAAGDYLQFSVSTLGLHGLGMSWDQSVDSALGARILDLKYSVDGGTTWSAYGLLADGQINSNGSGHTTWNSTTDQAYYAQSDNGGLANETLLNNQPQVLFRLTSEDSSSSGVYSYVDNVTITATPEPMTLAILSLGGLGLLLRRRRALA